MEEIFLHSLEAVPLEAIVKNEYRTYQIYHYIIIYRRIDIIFYKIIINMLIKKLVGLLGIIASWKLCNINTS